MKRTLALVIGVVALMLPGAVFAAGSATCQAYNPQTCSANANSNVQATTATGSTLPFTGLNVGLLVLGGGTLLGAGLVVRRLSRSTD
jgi:hypothetical protein